MHLLLARLKNAWIRTRIDTDSLSSLAKANLEALDALDPSRPLRSCRFVALDLETTGLDPKRDAILSVGAVRLAHGRIRLGDRFSEHVRPGGGIQPSSIRIHGIVPDMVATARPVRPVVRDLLAFVGGDILVGHHIAFDLAFLNRVIRPCLGFPLQNWAVDTGRLARAVLSPSSADPFAGPRHDPTCLLDALAGRLGVEIPGRHTAMGDALATAMVFQRMTALLEERGDGSLRDVL